MLGVFMEYPGYVQKALVCVIHFLENLVSMFSQKLVLKGISNIFKHGSVIIEG
jgi:hypothetical protein